MFLIHYIHRRKQNSEGGFVLIAALMAVMILMAVGFFVLTTTSQDIGISSRMVGERKAMSAAEAGFQWVSLNFSRTMTPASNQQVDATNDPHAKFSTTAPATNVVMPTVLAGGNGTMEYHVYNVSVTGINDIYSSSVIIDAAYIDGPWPPGTGHQ